MLTTLLYQKMALIAKYVQGVHEAPQAPLSQGLKRMRMSFNP
jgi:hypothetical protein